VRDLRALTLFAGGGGSCLGMVQAGLVVVGAIEHDPEIAGVYRRNLGDHVTVADIRSVGTEYGPVDVIWASPPCPNFSVAKQGAIETFDDIALGKSVARFIRELKPRYFFLENVWQYHKSESWSIIRQSLYSNKYWLDLAHVNAADFGVPQTRRRMIVRAICGEMVPMLPPAEPWRGWLSSIDDLVDDLPLIPFAPWQLKHLEPLMETTLVSGQYNKPSHAEFRRAHTVNHSLPAPTITTGFGKDARAFVTSNNKTTFGQGVRWEDQPAFSVTTQHTGKLRAMLVSGDTDGGVRAWLMNGKVVKLSHRCLARFQTFPDSFQLPAGSGLAGQIIGNAVPPMLAEKLVRATIRSCDDH